MTKELANPLKFRNLIDFLEAILNVIIIMAIPIVVFFLILAGFHYVTARGNPEKIKDASRSLMYGIIGGVIVVGATSILKIVESTVNNF